MARRTARVAITTANLEQLALIICRCREVTYCAGITKGNVTRFVASACDGIAPAQGRPSPESREAPVRGASRSCASAPITSGRCRRRTNARPKPPPSRGTFVKSSKLRKIRRPHTSAWILEGQSSRRRSPMKRSRTISVCCHQRLGRNGRNRLSIECSQAAADMIELPLHPQTGHARRPVHRSVLR